MESKRRYVHGNQRCAGTCGRLLRPSYLRIEEAPGTVQRFAQGMCKYCHRRTSPKPVLGEGKVIRPCVACGHPTRPQKMKAGAFPGTRLRVGELCRPCDSACLTVTEDRARYVASEVEGFVEARRKRGIPPEGRQIAC